MKNYPTPHIDATPGDFAKTVIMPGDPLRAQKIAEDFLEDCTIVSRVRAVPVYTGTYKRYGLPLNGDIQPRAF